MEIGREDLSLARLAEAHYDAVAILAEAGREALPNAIYGVWASDKPGQELVLTEDATDEFRIKGRKMFCSGAGVIDHALITVGGPAPLLVDLDLRTNQHLLSRSSDRNCQGRGGSSRTCRWQYDTRTESVGTPAKSAPRYGENWRFASRMICNAFLIRNTGECR